MLWEQSVQSFHAATVFFSLLSTLLPLSDAATAAWYLCHMNLRDPKQIRKSWLKGAGSIVYHFMKQSMCMIWVHVQFPWKCCRSTICWNTPEAGFEVKCFTSQKNPDRSLACNYSNSNHKPYFTSFGSWIWSVAFGWMAGCCQSCSFTPFLSWTQERK